MNKIYKAKKNKEKAWEERKKIRKFVNREMDKNL